MSIDLQMGFWPITEVVTPLPEPVEPDLATYDRFVVGFSGERTVLLVSSTCSSGA